MEESLKAFCSHYRLSSISVMHIEKHKPRSITVYVHWDSIDDASCASGHGDTFAQAFANALVEMDERRQPESEAA
jgi:ribosomal protein S12 methylthiotransferase accessory factor YcaO